MATSPSALSLGSLTAWSNWGEYNQTYFSIAQAILKMNTAMPVKIVACSNTGDLSPVGTVDIQLLVNQVDGNGNSVPHGVIYKIPYLRVQGGTNAVIIDPEPGDIGIALFASRDISSVLATKAQANPGSRRSYDFQDAMYVGGLLNGVPQQYVQFNGTGITVNSPSKITLIAPTIAMQGAVTMSEGLTVTNDVVANGISLDTHTHTSEAAGTPTSPPIP